MGRHPIAWSLVAAAVIEAVLTSLSESMRGLELHDITQEVAGVLQLLFPNSLGYLLSVMSDWPIYARLLLILPLSYLCGIAVERLSARYGHVKAVAGYLVFSLVTGVSAVWLSMRWLWPSS